MTEKRMERNKDWKEEEEQEESSSSEDHNVWCRGHENYRQDICQEILDMQDLWQVSQSWQHSQDQHQEHSQDQHEDEHEDDHQDEHQDEHQEQHVKQWLEQHQGQHQEHSPERQQSLQFKTDSWGIVDDSTISKNSHQDGDQKGDQAGDQKGDQEDQDGEQGMTSRGKLKSTRNQCMQAVLARQSNEYFDSFNKISFSWMKVLALVLLACCHASNHQDCFEHESQSLLGEAVIDVSSFGHIFSVTTPPPPLPLDEVLDLNISITSISVRLAESQLSEMNYELWYRSSPYAEARGDNSQWELLAQGPAKELLLDTALQDSSGHVMNGDANTYGLPEMTAEGGYDLITPDRNDSNTITSYYYKLPEFAPVRLPKWDGYAAFYVTLDRAIMHVGQTSALNEAAEVDVSSSLVGSSSLRLHVGEGVAFYPWLPLSTSYSPQRFLGKIWYDLSTTVDCASETPSSFPSSSPSSLPTEFNQFNPDELDIDELDIDEFNPDEMSPDELNKLPNNATIYLSTKLSIQSDAPKMNSAQQALFETTQLLFLTKELSQNCFQNATSTFVHQARNPLDTSLLEVITRIHARYDAAPCHPENSSISPIHDQMGLIIESFINGNLLEYEYLLEESLDFDIMGVSTAYLKDGYEEKTQQQQQEQDESQLTSDIGGTDDADLIAQTGDDESDDKPSIPLDAVIGSGIGALICLLFCIVFMFISKQRYTKEQRSNQNMNEDTNDGMKVNTNANRNVDINEDVERGDKLYSVIKSESNELLEEGVIAADACDSKERIWFNDDHHALESIQEEMVTERTESTESTNQVTTSIATIESTPVESTTIPIRTMQYTTVTAAAESSDTTTTTKPITIESYHESTTIESSNESIEAESSTESTPIGSNTTESPIESSKVGSSKVGSSKVESITNVSKTNESKTELNVTKSETHESPTELKTNESNTHESKIQLNTTKSEINEPETNELPSESSLIESPGEQQHKQEANKGDDEEQKQVGKMLDGLEENEEEERKRNQRVEQENEEEIEQGNEEDNRKGKQGDKLNVNQENEHGEERIQEGEKANEQPSYMEASDVVTADDNDVADNTIKELVHSIESINDPSNNDNDNYNNIGNLRSKPEETNVKENDMGDSTQVSNNGHDWEPGKEVSGDNMTAQSNDNNHFQRQHDELNEEHNKEHSKEQHNSAPTSTPKEPKPNDESGDEEEVNYKFKWVRIKVPLAPSDSENNLG